MAAQSSGNRMNPSDSDENDDLFTPSPFRSSSYFAHLQRNGGMQGNYRSFSSDLEDDCFHPTSDGCYGSSESYEKNGASSMLQEPLSPVHVDYKSTLMRQGSIVDGLLHEIYDHWHGGRQDSFDSDTLTECSSTSEFLWCSRHDISTYSMDGGYQSSLERRQAGSLNRSFLNTQNVTQLRRLLSNVQRLTAVMSARLVRQLKRRDRRLAKRNRNYDVVTAILQAASLKRQIDTRMRFSIQPPTGQPSAFDQWKDAMRAVCRLPMGIPAEFRKKVWLSLADHYLVQLRINWEKTLRFAFNERSNPDDDKLGMQIVKDLHRTGCSNFSGDDNAEDRAILKRVLLAYARWNKRVGYCQGFNVIAALLLNVMDRKEDDALKVMIFLIDSVLPESYFANNLRALSVDMAVFRDLLALTYPRLSKHLDRLQLQAQDIRTGACYEPPLTNVFTMQWFLTLFATCLPVNIVLRVWDSVLLEGSEILLRTALTIWGKLSKRILSVSSADEFYSVMGELSSSIMQGSLMDGDSIIKSLYSLGGFPFPQLNELREKYTYNIRPLTPATSSGGKKMSGGRSLIKAMLYSDDDEMDDDDITAMACMPGEMGNSPSSSSSDISVLGPGVYGSDPMTGGGGRGGGAMQMERMSTDINSLKLQYQRLKERQQQAHIIIAAASQKKAQLISSNKKSSSSSSSHGRHVPSMPSSILLPSIESPIAMNHLFVGKSNRPSAKNRLVTEGPRISQQAPPANTSALLSKQLQAVANAQAVSKSQRMRSSRPKSNDKCVSSVTPTKTHPAKDYSSVSVLSLPQGQHESTSEQADLMDCGQESGTRLCDTQPTTEITEHRGMDDDGVDINEKCVQTSFEVESNQDNSIPSEESEKGHNCVKTQCSNVEEISGIPCGVSQPTISCDNQVPYSGDQCLSPLSPAIKSDVSPSIQSISNEVSPHSPSLSELSSFHSRGDDNENIVSFQSQSSHTDSLPDDSGIESSSTASPSTTPRKKMELKSDSDYVDEIQTELECQNIGQDEENEIIRTSLIEDGNLYHVSDSNQQVSILSPSSLVIENDIEVKDHDGVLENDKEKIGCDVLDVLTIKNTHSEESCITDLGNGNEDVKRNDNNVKQIISNCSKGGSSEVPVLLSIVTATSPQRKFFHRSLSSSEDSYVTSPGVIETIPVPENLDVSVDEDHESYGYSRSHKLQSFSKENVLQTGTNLTGHKEESGTEKHRGNRSKSTQNSSHSSGKDSFKMEAMKAELTGHNDDKHYRRYSTPASSLLTMDSGLKTVKPHNPFPVKLFTANRAKTGLKLGLYTATTLEQLKGLKPRTTST